VWITVNDFERHPFPAHTRSLSGRDSPKSRPCTCRCYSCSKLYRAEPIFLGAHPDRLECKREQVRAAMVMGDFEVSVPQSDPCFGIEAQPAKVCAQWERPRLCWNWPPTKLDGGDRCQKAGAGGIACRTGGSCSAQVAEVSVDPDGTVQVLPCCLGESCSMIAGTRESSLQCIRDASYILNVNL
jgi:hypothetical protein